ncbi:proline racemase family protein [Stieleria sp. JC731]|uniref:proline racemase family protein n=1 Tax=Pirellulaceae TaxID=2691357 RepID=UPI001E5539F8|nr:proline racemase family protein [Stieleria sp. JC731]MCC9600425.1 proline racemase family protein [Stieleria sp. JC731]
MSIADPSSSPVPCSPERFVSQYIDTHTAGEPTRVVHQCDQEFMSLMPCDLVRRLSSDSDALRSSLINEPRGHEAMVGAILCQPKDPECCSGVVFINNEGYLGMCGHGAIGVAVALHYMGRIQPGNHFIDTPVGKVGLKLVGSNDVEINNVASYRFRHDVQVSVPELGVFHGDVAWGGNWFFLVKSCPWELTFDNIAKLTDYSIQIRDALSDQGITGKDGAFIDHVELFGPATTTGADSRNFVLCPGGAYDRSPCGTGTSAKLACLAADGRLAPGESWVQESIIGSQFVASYRTATDGTILPTICGQAYVCGEGRTIFQQNDPFAFGITGSGAQGRQALGKHSHGEAVQ